MFSGGCAGGMRCLSLEAGRERGRQLAAVQSYPVLLDWLQLGRVVSSGLWWCLLPEALGSGLVPMLCPARPPATPGCSVRLPLERRTRFMPIAWGPLPNIAQYRAQLQVGGCCSIHCSGRVLPGWKPALAVWLD
jgi:hypothetical protein